MMGDSRHSVTNLQIQFDEYRERSRKDLLEAQRSSKDRLAELQRAQTNLKTQQEEVRKDDSRNVQERWADRCYCYQIDTFYPLSSVCSKLSRKLLFGNEKIHLRHSL